MNSPAAISKSDLALRFFALSLSLLVTAMLVAATGITLTARLAANTHAIMPTAFWISTALLAAGSATMQRAAWHVRFERHSSFCRLLLWSLAIGTLFVGVQTCGLWRLVLNQTPANSPLPESAETGANAFVVMVAGLHGVHFLVALLFLAWVTVNAFAHRYDHEYSWSVTFCAWFWHTLGIVWLVILALFAAGAVTGFEGISVPDPQADANVSAIVPRGGGTRG